MSSSIYGPLDHYDYGETDPTCQCELCIDWRGKLAIVLQYQSYLPRDNCPESACHQDLKGPCAECKLALRARTTYLASLARRDFYSECSWHAFMMESPILGSAFMEWVQKIMDDRVQYNSGWWIQRATCLPMQYWITMFKQSILSGVDLLNSVDETINNLPRAYLNTSPAVSGMAMLAASGMA